MQRVIVSSAFIFRDSNVLVARRKSDSKIYPGKWELPGGKVEPGEDPSDAANREVMEELGIVVDVQRPFHVFSQVPERDLHYIEIAFMCSLSGPEPPMKLTEHDEARWITEKELDSLDMTKEMRESIISGFALMK
jgi:8-oxo-dGTP diphosphatase